ncbi:MAG: hydantoinase B/oxoprolinase family protein, partial [Pseudomonadota bacterium]
GPITVWRKDLRAGSGGAGALRGGLGQTIEIEPRAGYDFYFNAMFDRVKNPAQGRDGGMSGGEGRVELADGTTLRSKGRQLVKNGQRLVLSLPGGGGYGAPSERDPALVSADLDAGLITKDQAKSEYGQDI